MLVCDCGWKGVNLISNIEDNTARCPKCRTVFVGIPANRAVIVSDEEERSIVEDCDLLVILCEQLSPSKPR